MDAEIEAGTRRSFQSRLEDLEEDQETSTSHGQRDEPLWISSWIYVLYRE